MTRLFATAWITLLMACGSSHPNTKTVESGSASGSDTAAAPCGPDDCGPEPPISPDTCPKDAKISTECLRAASGACERKILCDGKDANETAAP